LYVSDFNLPAVLPAEQKMVRIAFLVFGVIAMATSGCCGPRGCGAGCGDCGTTSVGSCGCGSGSCGVARGGPLSALRNARRGMICGSGCGEAYIGEWISTPPDCNDPCCDDQFVGGAVKARPFCRQRGCLLRGLYGKRDCSGSESSLPCGCGEVSCGGVCDSGSYTTTEHVVGDYSNVVPAGVQEGSCGCASCTAASPMASRLASMSRGPVGSSITASARSKHLTERAQRIRQ